jgi:hypothetical protein
MCHEFWMRRREREAREADDVWREFERTTPIADPEPPAEAPEPTTAEAPAEALTTER